MYGVGLRPKHYREFLEGSPRVDFVEAISENFMGLGGRPLAVLEQARRDRPVFLHGVSLGLASVEPLDERYLTQWKALVARIEPAVVSDHLCWGRAHRRYSHDLLPFPFTHEALALCVSRVQQVQDFLGRQLTLENVSSYLTFARNDFTEWDFLAELVRRSGCGVLLDVNNIYVSAQNHGFDADAYLAAIPRESVTQFHLAGHQRRPDLIIDTHDGPVSDEVWALYARAKQRFGEAPTLIEWDDAVPELEVLLAEAEKARRFSSATSHASSGPAEPGAVAFDAVELRGVQHTMFSAICDPEPVSEAAAKLVLPHGALTNTQRLEVYAEMYWLRMRDTLRDAFAKTRAAVGDERFDGFVADFLREHPSTHFSLDRLGAQFAQTLPAELRDAAALEWARAESFLAVDAPVIEFSALQAHPAETWGALSLELHPSVRVLRGTVVWRTGFTVQLSDISAEEAAALEVAQRGAPLGEVLEPFGDDAQAALDALASWFGESMVSRVRE